MIGDNKSNRRKHIPNFYPLDNETPPDKKELERRKRVIERRQQRIDICLNCTKYCKTGTCEIFKK